MIRLCQVIETNYLNLIQFFFPKKFILLVNYTFQKIVKEKLIKLYVLQNLRYFGKETNFGMDTKIEPKFPQESLKNKKLRYPRKRHDWQNIEI